MSKDTQLILMTPGILLKKLDRDPMLKEYTHVLIDEVCAVPYMRCAGVEVHFFNVRFVCWHVHAQGTVILAAFRPYPWMLDELKLGPSVYMPRRPMPRRPIRF